MAPRKRPADAPVSDGAVDANASLVNILKKMTPTQLRLKVRKTPGVREKKKVDGKWVPKNKEDMIADLCKAPVSDGQLGLKVRKTHGMRETALRLRRYATNDGDKDSRSHLTVTPCPRKRTSEKRHKGFCLAEAGP